jgi:hypothetical protein
MKKILLLFLLLPLGLHYVNAQTEPAPQDSVQQLYLVTKTDGGEFYGYILSDDGREILLMTKTIGKIYISKADIASIVPIDPEEIMTDGQTSYREYRNKGPFTTRYYFTTNALPIEKGENYALLHLYGPELHFAVSDRLSLGVMATWIASPIALAAKYNLYSQNKTHLAVGSINGSMGYIGNAQGYGGLHWLSITQGDRIRNISFSAGFGYVDLGENLSPRIGEAYLYSPEDPLAVELGYAVPEWRAYTAIENELDRRDESSRLSQGFRSALVLGIGGIAPVGKKASFIFDGMLLHGKQKDIVYSDYPITVGVWDENLKQYIDQTYTIGKGDVVNTNAYETNIVLMPAMRFNQSYSKAFQVSLSGLIHIKNGEVFTVPFPMVSWLRLF